jgi:hypothetical protein
MKRMLIVMLLGLAGCAGAYQQPAAPPISAAELDRACIAAAGDKLSSLLGREASNGRTVPVPAEIDRLEGGLIGQRVVELDSVSAGLPTTYVFYCGQFAGGRIITEPMGRKV